MLIFVPRINMHPLVAHIREALHENYTDAEALSLAKILLVDVFGFSTLELYGGKDRSFSEKDQMLLSDILGRLCRNEPIQYIIGVETFKGLPFEVNRNVLIPRPETQELVDWIVSDCQKCENCRILDIGTGSGCIPVSLAYFLKQAEIETWDVSEAALEIARRNSELNGVKVTFKRQDVFEDFSIEKYYDVIVSNPPYITEKEKGGMEANVLDWEPEIALFVPDTAPLLFYERIARLGVGMLNPGGILYFEINRAYGQDICVMLEDMKYKHVELRKDFFGNDRMVKAIR